MGHTLRAGRRGRRFSAYTLTRTRHTYILYTDTRRPTLRRGHTHEHVYLSRVLREYACSNASRPREGCEAGGGDDRATVNQRDGEGLVPPSVSVSVSIETKGLTGGTSRGNNAARVSAACCEDTYTHTTIHISKNNN